MPVQETKGSVSAQGYGFGLGSLPIYVEDVFSTWLYDGTGSTGNQIVNGIDLSTKGGMVWIKSRSTIYDHYVSDTVRGTQSQIRTNGTGAAAYDFDIAYNTNGFTLNTSTGQVNNSGQTFASWTFREQPKFFDIVTYTGDGTSNRQIAHNLGSTPGAVIVKCTSLSGTSWRVYHRSLTAGYTLYLNLTNAQTLDSETVTAVSSTTFTVGTGGSGINGNGRTYVAYLFAHNAGGFGASGNDNVISCGSYTGTGSSVSVTLGYEPQWVMIKRTDSTGNWVMLDNMRGTPYSQAPFDLYANTSGAEQQNFGSTSTGFITNPTGFGWNDGSLQINANGGTYIYIAIRRGPMKTPTVGTSVFTPVARTGTGVATTSTAGFPVDWSFIKTRTVSGQSYQATRLTANAYLQATNTNAETTIASTYPTTVFQSNTLVNLGSTDVNDSGRTYVDWFFRRAPGFFDVVCYTGTGSLVTNTVTHNLTVAPELVIVKVRSTTGDWSVLPAVIGGTRLFLNLTDAASSASIENAFGNNVVYVAPTATNFTVTGTRNNTSGATYVTYLFASCAGVSKVGSYTGTGTTQQINCGFTGGARFVMIKRTDSTGDWYVWDSARGIVAGNDPYLLLNSALAEVTNTDYVDTYAQGFEISSTAPAAINANGGTYIFLAVA